MTTRFKTLLIRTLSGAIFITLMILGVFHPLVMVLLMGVVSLLAIHEFNKMISGPADYLSEGLMMLSALLLLLFVPLESMQSIQTLTWTTSVMSFVMFLLSFPAVVVAYVIIFASAEVFRRRACPIEKIGRGIFGMIWIILPLGMLTSLTCVYPELVLAFFLLIWGNDTFAYLGGSMYGKHKMIEKVSPKKTWEGTFTGAICTVLIAVVLYKIPFFSEFSCINNLIEWIVFALIVVLFGTMGDLLESLFKRNASIKDSGNIMPGHGGILDRFDSILFAAVPISLYIFSLLYLSY